MLSGIGSPVFSLQRLRSDHEAAALAFERENRAYFAQSISDRGDMFFERFSEQHRELMASKSRERALSTCSSMNTRRWWAASISTTFG